MCICMMLDLLGIQSRCYCVVFNNRITSIVDDYVQQYVTSGTNACFKCPSTMLISWCVVTDKTLLKIDLQAILMILLSYLFF